MNSVYNFLGIIASLPKTIIFNLKTLPFRQAIRLPIFLWYKVRIIEAKAGVIQLPKKIFPFMIRLGKGGTKQVIEHSHSLISIGGGKLIFKGIANMAAGCSLDCTGELIIGDHFSTNKNAFLTCSKRIVIGNYVMLGDNCTIRDSDGHTVYLNGNPKVSQKEIIIGNNVWIASYAHVLKGSKILDNSILAYRSVLTRKFEDSNLLLGGAPAKELQRDINWGKFVQ